MYSGSKMKLLSLNLLNVFAYCRNKTVSHSSTMDTLRQNLAAAVIEGSDTKGPIVPILDAEIPLHQKFTCLDIIGLLRVNSQVSNLFSASVSFCQKVKLMGFMKFTEEKTLSRSF